MTKLGVSFEKGNVDDLRRQLIMLLGDRERVLPYKEPAREYVCGKYDWDKVAARTAVVYENWQHA